MSTIEHNCAEPTLGDIARDVWAARFWLLGGAFFGLLLGMAVLFISIPQYRATMIVAPTTRSGTPDISALFPNNASFAMEYVLQSFGPGDSSDFMRFEAILREATIASTLLKDPIIRNGLRNAKRYRVWQKAPPADATGLADWLQKRLVIESVGTTTLRRLVFQHPEPAFAGYMLEALYNAADNTIRTELAGKTENRIAYLRDALMDTDNPEHRRALTKILLDQEQIKMILAVNEAYAASIAEPPSVGLRPDWPRRSLILPAFMMAGFFLSFILYNARRVVRAA